MQVDFHFSGTYVLARLAGFSRDAALRIASAAQFVDDATETRTFEHPDGPRFSIEPTGHGISQLRELNNLDDQIRVWVPFHFLPGASGEVLTTRLICWPDSPVAARVMEFAIRQVRSTFGLESLGVACHAYADTFAHHGFCGVSSRLNRVGPESVVSENPGPELQPVGDYVKRHALEAGMLRNFRINAMIQSGETATKSAAAQAATGALGHAGVATFPDAPYLKWSYRYESEERWGRGNTERSRDNVQDFMRASERLVFHLSMASRDTYGSTKPIPFNGVRDSIERILRTPGEAPVRASAWQTALRSGSLPIVEEIPAYPGDAWKASMQTWPSFPDASRVATEPAFRFVQAASLHRTFVLRDLLPQFGICLT